jgi:hypothetical protein
MLRREKWRVNFSDGVLRPMSWAESLLDFVIPAFATAVTSHLDASGRKPKVPHIPQRYLPNFRAMVSNDRRT